MKKLYSFIYPNKEIYIPVSIIIAVSSIYYLTGYNGPTYFDLFVKFADKMLQGILWFDEDVRIYDFAPVGEKYFVVQPPFPAILLIPLVKIFGINLAQNLVSIVLGSIASAVTYGIARRLKFSKLHSIFISILFSFGTLIWYLSVVGSTWYFAHVVAVLFMQLAIFEALGRQRGFIMGLFWGAAFLSRLPTIIGFPFICSFILFSNEKKEAKNQTDDPFDIRI